MECKHFDEIVSMKGYQAESTFYVNIRTSSELRSLEQSLARTREQLLVNADCRRISCLQILRELRSTEILISLIGLL